MVEQRHIVTVEGVVKQTVEIEVYAVDEEAARAFVDTMLADGSDLDDLEIISVESGEPHRPWHVSDFRAEED